MIRRLRTAGDYRRAAPGEHAGLATSGLGFYVAGLMIAAGGVVFASGVDHIHPPGQTTWSALPVLGSLLVAAEQLRVRFRRGGDVDAVTMFEAVLAPLLFAFATPVVVISVAFAQVITSIVRRATVIKGAFNVAQWALAVGVGGLVLGALGADEASSLRSLGALVAALACVGIVNNAAFTGVLAIANRQSLAAVLRGLAPIIVPAWIGGWVVNVLIGLLFTLAYAAHPAAVVLFPVPLVLLHLAYRGYAAARADQLRLSGLRHSAQALAVPLDPKEAIPGYLREVARCFESRAAMLALASEGGGREVHLFDVATGDCTVRVEPADALSLGAALVAQPAPVRISATGGGTLAAGLVDAGWRDCISAPLLDERRLFGALIVFDQGGLEGRASGDLEVLDALARETAHAFAKGRLLESVLDERRTLTQIVTSTSDGIFTVADDGALLSWNAACERITGLPAGDVIGHGDVLRRVRARALAGGPVDVTDWAKGTELPQEITIVTADGARRRLSCSYGRASDDDARSATLVVVARDVTPAAEYEELREQFSRLVEAEAAQRLVVEQLQQAVVPARPDINGADLAAAYVASDPSAPTGGDLYDWRILPSGELHIAVVDVLGHGVTATKDALAVVHALRLVAVDGTPLEDVVSRADELLTAQNPELVATVVVVRYDPVSGRVRVVSGGHPPALVVAADGSVTQLAATGGAIGWPVAGSDSVVTTRLNPNDSLVLYTDGLIEARKDVLEGLDALVRHAGEVAHLDANQLANELVTLSLAGAERRDDTLALVLRRTRVAALPERMRWSLAPGDRAAVSSTRRAFVEWLTRHGLATDELALVATELLSNAIVVARGSVVLQASVLADRIVLDVADDGTGHEQMEQLGREAPWDDREDGRGLFIVRSLSDEVSVMSTTEGTVVRCVVGTSAGELDQIRVQRDAAGGAPPNATAAGAPLEP